MRLCITCVNDAHKVILPPASHKFHPFSSGPSLRPIPVSEILEILENVPGCHRVTESNSVIWKLAERVPLEMDTASLTLRSANNEQAVANPETSKRIAETNLRHYHAFDRAIQLDLNAPLIDHFEVHFESPSLPSRPLPPGYPSLSSRMLDVIVQIKSTSESFIDPSPSSSTLS